MLIALFTKNKKPVRLQKNRNIRITDLCLLVSAIALLEPVLATVATVSLVPIGFVPVPTYSRLLGL